MGNLGREGRLARSVVGLDMTISMPNEPPTATQQSRGSNVSVLRALT